MKNFYLLTALGLVSLPFSHYLINWFSFSAEVTALYWLLLGINSLFAFNAGKLVQEKFILNVLKGTNLILGSFGFLTASVMGISFVYWY